MAQVSLLPVFPSRTNLKLHSIHITPKLAVSNFYFSRTYGSDCISAVVLRK